MPAIKRITKGFFLALAAIVAFACFSQAFVEAPPYPVSATHGLLTVLLGLTALVFSGNNRIAGVQFLCLMLLNGLFPDLWLRWPQFSLIGLCVAGSLTAAAPSIRLNSIAIAGILTLSVSFMLIIIYFPEPFARNLLWLNLGVTMLTIAVITFTIMRKHIAFDLKSQSGLWGITAFLVVISWFPLTQPARIGAQYLLTAICGVCLIALSSRNLLVFPFKKD